MSGGKRALLTLGAIVVLLAVIGAVYLEIFIQFQSTRTGWMVIDNESAGTLLTGGNVRQITNALRKCVRISRMAIEAISISCSSVSVSV